MKLMEERCVLKIQFQLKKTKKMSEFNKWGRISNLAGGSCFKETSGSHTKDG